MKQVVKLLLTAAALAALAVPAVAADKLIVKNAAGTADVFKVDDTGTITTTGKYYFDSANGRLGISTVAPQGSFHLVDTQTALSRGIIAAQHNDGNHAAVIVIRKSRGTETVPAAVQYPSAGNGDYVATIHAQAWDGAAYQNGASFAYRIDGPVSSGNTPTALQIFTGNSGPTKKINLQVSSNGNVAVGMGTAVATQRLEVNGGVKLNTTTTIPTCDSTTSRGTIWLTQGAAGAKDSLQVCAKDSSDVYAWRTIY